MLKSWSYDRPGVYEATIGRFPNAPDIHGVHYAGSLIEVSDGKLGKEQVALLELTFPVDSNEVEGLGDVPNLRVPFELFLFYKGERAKEIIDLADKDDEAKLIQTAIADFGAFLGNPKHLMDFLAFYETLVFRAGRRSARAVFRLALGITKHVGDDDEDDIMNDEDDAADVDEG